MGERHLRRVLHEQANMVFLSVELGQGRVEVRAYLRHDLFAQVEHFWVEHATPVFGDEDQVDVEGMGEAASVSSGGVWVLGWVVEVVATFAA